MKPKVSRCITASILLAALAVSPALAAPGRHDASQRITYSLVNLGTALGSNNSAASSINDLGFVAGAAVVAGSTTVQNAVLWVFGFPFSLGSLGGPGTSSSVVFPGLDDRAEVVGITETANPDPLNEPWSCSAFIARAPGTSCVGFAWRNGVMTALPTLGGSNGFAAGVNNLGQVVGWAETATHDPTCDFPQVRQFRAVLWEPNGQVVQLPAFHGEPDQAAVGINDKGQVVGISGICGSAVGALSAKHAVLWENGTLTDLGSLGGVGWNTPISINNQGDVVGFTNLANDASILRFRAFLWTRSSGREKNLGTLPGDAISEALSINDLGQVVGVSYGTGFSHPRAVVWVDGVATDLNSLTPGSSLVLTAANAINGRGEITGTANDPSGNQVSFVAIPNRD